MFRERQALVISEPDIDLALEHLAKLPYREPLPTAWDRKHLLNLIRDAIGKNPKVDEAFGVAPGVFAIIKPFGIDLAGRRKPDGRLQIWLAVRDCGTNPDRVVEL